MYVYEYKDINFEVENVKHWWKFNEDNSDIIPYRLNNAHNPI